MAWVLISQMLIAEALLLTRTSYSRTCGGGCGGDKKKVNRFSKGDSQRWGVQNKFRVVSVGGRVQGQGDLWAGTWVSGGY